MARHVQLMSHDDRHRRTVPVCRAAPGFRSDRTTAAWPTVSIINRRSAPLPIDFFDLRQIS
jgi:hypothetical protein